MKTGKLLVTVLSLALLVSVTSIGVGFGEATTRDDGIEIDVIEGPERPFVNQTENYQIELTGTFGVDDEEVEDADNWTLQVETDLESTIEPSDNIEQTQVEEDTDNLFNLGIEIHEEGEGEITFSAYVGKDDEVSFQEKTFDIEAEIPERTSIEITNPTEANIENAKLGLYINNEIKSLVTISELGPNEEQTITFEWSKRGLEGGEHTMEVWMDYSDPETKEDFEKDSIVMERTFEIEEETNPWLIAGIVIAVIVGALLIFIWYQKKRRESRRPW